MARPMRGTAMPCRASCLMRQVSTLPVAGGNRRQPPWEPASAPPGMRYRVSRARMVCRETRRVPPRTMLKASLFRAL